jgi:hypothetical protein
MFVIQWATTDLTANKETFISPDVTGALSLSEIDEKLLGNPEYAYMLKTKYPDCIALNVT